MLSCLLHTPPTGTWPATQACALTGIRTHDLLVCGTMMSNLLAHTGQGPSCSFLSILLWTNNTQNNKCPLPPHLPGDISAKEDIGPSIPRKGPRRGGSWFAPCWLSVSPGNSPTPSPPGMQTVWPLDTAGNAVGLQGFSISPHISYTRSSVHAVTDGNTCPVRSGLADVCCSSWLPLRVRCHFSPGRTGSLPAAGRGHGPQWPTGTPAHGLGSTPARERASKDLRFGERPRTGGGESR